MDEFSEDFQAYVYVIYLYNFIFKSLTKILYIMNFHKNIYIFYFKWYHKTIFPCISKTGKNKSRIQIRSLPFFNVSSLKPTQHNFFFSHHIVCQRHCCRPNFLFLMRRRRLASNSIPFLSSFTAFIQPAQHILTHIHSIHTHFQCQFFFVCPLIIRKKAPKGPIS